MTALLWMPYILNVFFKRGILKTLTYVEKDVSPMSAWASRAKAAHANAIENLVLLAGATLVYVQLAGLDGSSDGTVAMCLKVYFFARLAHYVLYIFNVPFGRTVTFLTGWAATVCIILKAMNLASM